MKTRVAVMIFLGAVLTLLISCVSEGHYSPPQHPYPLCEMQKSLPAVGPRGNYKVLTEE